MAVDKSYGSGKSRSAANSSARRRVAAGQMTKSKKGPAEKIKAGRARMAASPLGQLADTVLGFALPVGKVKAAAAGLRAAGQAGKASALASRVAAKEVGQGAGRGYSSLLTGKLREASESVYPRSSGAQSGEYLGMNSREITANLARKTGRAAGVSMEDIRAFSKATANSTTGFTNFSKKLPKTGRGVGTVNQKGLEKMIAGGREPSREMLRIPQILKGTNEAYENIAQKAIKAAGLRKTPKKRGR